MNTSTKSQFQKSRSSGKSGNSGQGQPGSTTSKWEWVAAACGLLLVLGILGYIVYYALTTEAQVPSVTAEAIRIEPTRGGYVVRFRARNHSSATAAGLHITGELRQGSSMVEASQIGLDYLPPFSEHEGGLIFQKDPKRYELRIIPKAYREP